MPALDVARQETVEAALDVIGAYGKSKAEKIGDRAIAAFRARDWEVFTWDEINNLTWDEINNLDDTVRIPEAAPQTQK